MGHCSLKVDTSPLRQHFCCGLAMPEHTRTVTSLHLDTVIPPVTTVMQPWQSFGLHSGPSLAYDRQTSSRNHKNPLQNISFNLVYQLRGFKILSFGLLVMLVLWGHRERESPEAGRVGSSVCIPGECSSHSILVGSRGLTTGVP